MYKFRIIVHLIHGDPIYSDDLEMEEKEFQSFLLVLKQLSESNIRFPVTPIRLTEDSRPDSVFVSGRNISHVVMVDLNPTKKTT
jgi:hypothetical protein